MDFDEIDGFVVSRLDHKVAGADFCFAFLLDYRAASQGRFLSFSIATHGNGQVRIMKSALAKLSLLFDYFAYLVASH
jgi:hypothetical protein